MQKKLIAEVVGTFILALAVFTSLQVDSVLATPMVAALVLGLFVYSIGHASGCHINPAVTIGLWSIGKTTNREAAMYIIAQMFGGMAAMVIANALVSGLPLTTAPDTTAIFIAELIGTAVFTFGIAAVVYGKTHTAANGLVIGGSLLLGIVIAVQLGSGGILNPAVALTLGALNLSYVAGAIAGAVIGMNLYKRFIE